MNLLRSWLFVAALLVLLTAPPSPARVRHRSRHGKNPDPHHGQVLIVTGTITGSREGIARAGNPYTTFRLKGGGASVAVFVWKHQRLRMGCAYG